MGKGSRNKAGRAGRRKKTADVPVAVTAIQELRRATLVVGEMFGSTRGCAQAAGLLHEIARELGHYLFPLPVAVLGFDRQTGTRIVMGPRASATLTAEERTRLINQRPGGRDTGHLVLVSEELALMLDPNMRQLEQDGIEAPSVILPLADDSLSRGNWLFTEGALSLEYLADAENRALLPVYEQARAAYHDDAPLMSADVRAGLSVTQVVERARRRHGSR